jgi:hypothetical protein
MTDVSELADRLAATTLAARVTMVDTADALQRLCRTLTARAQPIAVDFEGIDLCRTGELCLAQISDGQSVWLVDIVALREEAFSEGGLKELLEDAAVLKVGFDGRADADALHHQFGCGLFPFYDVQIASCRRQDAEQGRCDRYVHGLGKAIGCYLRDNRAKAAELDTIKTAGKALSVPQCGGAFAVWKERPLPPALVRYAAVDVALLLAMRDAWKHFSPDQQNQASAGKRLRSAVKSTQPAKGSHMAVKRF